MSPRLQLKEVTAGYGSRIVLSQISISLYPGQNVGVIGANGTGKSTLLRFLLEPAMCKSGEILLDGCPAATIATKTRARSLAACTNDFLRPPHFTIREFVLLGRFPWLGWLGHYTPQDREIADKALAECGLANLADQPMGQLSSGQCQLAAIARMLAQVWQVPRAILVLDEITANLDLARKLEIFQLLEQWRRKGHLLVQAIHDCNLAATFCTHLLGIKNGHVLFFGPVQEVFIKENLSALYDWPVGIQPHPDIHLPQAYTHLHIADLPCHSSTMCPSM